jgi:hypothetical protein
MCNINFSGSGVSRSRFWLRASFPAPAAARDFSLAHTIFLCRSIFRSRVRFLGPRANRSGFVYWVLVSHCSTSVLVAGCFSGRRFSCLLQASALLSPFRIEFRSTADCVPRCASRQKRCDFSIPALSFVAAVGSALISRFC